MSRRSTIERLLRTCSLNEVVALVETSPEALSCWSYAAAPTYQKPFEHGRTPRGWTHTGRLGSHAESDRRRAQSGLQSTLILKGLVHHDTDAIVAASTSLAISLKRRSTYPSPRYYRNYLSQARAAAAKYRAAVYSGDFDANGMTDFTIFRPPPELPHPLQRRHHLHPHWANSETSQPDRRVTALDSGASTWTTPP